MSRIAARARRAYSSKIKPLRAVRSSPQILNPLSMKHRGAVFDHGFFDVKFSSQTAAIQTTSTTKNCFQGHSYSERTAVLIVHDCIDSEI